MSDLKKQFKQLQSGNNNVFDEIYYQTYKSVYMVSYAILKDEEKAKDIMQNTYMQLLDKIKTINVFDYPKAWLITIARNLSINEFNRRKKETVYDITDPINQSIFGTDNIVESPTIELAKKILSEHEFIILTLCAIDDYKRREVAELLDIPLNTVTWKYNQAIEKMKIAMKEE